MPETNSLTQLAQRTRQAARQLGAMSAEAKNAALDCIALALEEGAAQILAANAIDCEEAAKSGLKSAIYNRLKLDDAKLNSAITGVRDVAKLADPVGDIQIHRELDRGLILQRVTCPLGVLGIIFEARPDAVIQIASLAIKSGNGAILKGGKEALNSCRAIVDAIHRGLAKTEIPPETLRLLTTREETLELLQLDQFVDLIIPRGSNEFVRFVQDNTRIPVLGHADGICHLYVDEAADLTKAVEIAVDAKIQYAAACNAIETLLVHQAVAVEFLPQVVARLQAVNVKVLGDDRTRQILDRNRLEIMPATETDWATEYSDLILSVKVVDSLTDAIEHINTYGSRHTEAIVTEDARASQVFRTNVDAAGVFQNCSTRFADGFRYGFGAEVGISTQKMPPRGPVGLEGLVTYKYHVVGEGQIVADYTGTHAKPFTHRML
jgi:glutamate-5-semialdehyde dehydrogenase